MNREEFKNNILSNLNEAQKAAVEYCEGPELVIACAGSGKTRVLTHKIAYLLACGYEPMSILALTFTKKAAREMMERVDKLFNGMEVSKSLVMGTFHSVFARILRIEHYAAGLPANFIIYDQSDSKSTISDIIKQMGLAAHQYPTQECQARISWLKNNRMYGPAEYKADSDERSHDFAYPKLPEIFERYQAALVKAGALDFDDILMRMCSLIENNPDIVRKYQSIFKYILVDEYQDTNIVQDKIVRILSHGHNRICVVGDDAQSIYAFRGAIIDNIINFGKTFSDVKTFKLEENYRSTPDIINAANNVIYKNEKQIRKEVFTNNPAGDKVHIVGCDNKFDEAEYIAKMILNEVQTENHTYDEYTVLYRINSLSAQIEKELREKKIPYKIYGALSFFQREEIKNLLAYLKLAVKPADDESLKRIFDYPARRIADRTLAVIMKCADEHSISLYEALDPDAGYSVDFANKGLEKHAVEFFNMIKEFVAYAESHSLVDSIKHIYTESGMEVELGKDQTESGEERRQNIAELVNMVKSFADERDGEIKLSDFVSELAVDGMTDDIDDDKPKVKLMTIHGAKGLEFDTVFIIGCIEGVFPITSIKNKTVDIEEETRLAYVGMTRAKNRLYMIHYSENYMWGRTQKATESRFTKCVEGKYCIRDSYGVKKYSSGYSAGSMWDDDMDDFEEYKEERFVINLPYEKKLVGKYEKFKDDMCYKIGQKKIKLFLNSKMKAGDFMGSVLRKLLEAVSSLINAAKYQKYNDDSYSEDYYCSARSETNKAIDEIFKHNENREEEKITMTSSDESVMFGFPGGRKLVLHVGVTDYNKDKIASGSVSAVGLEQDSLDCVESLIKDYFDAEIRKKYKVDESGVCEAVRKEIEAKERAREKQREIDEQRRKEREELQKKLQEEYENEKKAGEEAYPKIKDYVGNGGEDVFSEFNEAELSWFVKKEIKDKSSRDIVDFIHGVCVKREALALINRHRAFADRTKGNTVLKADGAYKKIYIVSKNLPVVEVNQHSKKLKTLNKEDKSRIGTLKDFVNAMFRNLVNSGNIFGTNNF